MDVNIVVPEGKDFEIAKLKEQLRISERTIKAIDEARNFRVNEALKEVKKLKERNLWQRIINATD